MNEQERTREERIKLVGGKVKREAEANLERQAEEKRVTVFDEVGGAPVVHPEKTAKELKRRGEVSRLGTKYVFYGKLR